MDSLLTTVQPDPCPFCGSRELSIAKTTMEEGDSKVWFYVCCNTCAATGPPESEPDLCIRTWNQAQRQPQKRSRRVH